ncbi:response regulator [Spirosoma pomorum]
MNQIVKRKKQGKRQNILVVEDNADQWFIIQWALKERFPEVEPVWFSNASQVLMYLECCLENTTQLPKLILLDLYLPNRENGWRLLEAIKLHHVYREIPAIMLSRSGDPEDIRESYMLRINSYIVKPDNYEKWLDCFTAFRHYWWEAATLPISY